jgi:hypothetical protein
VNLLLTCSTIPEFSQHALDLWNKFCIAEWMPGRVVPYLMFAPASSSAHIDAIVFLQPNMEVGFVQGAGRANVAVPRNHPMGCALAERRNRTED